MWSPWKRRKEGRHASIFLWLVLGYWTSQYCNIGVQYIGHILEEVVRLSCE